MKKDSLIYEDKPISPRGKAKVELFKNGELLQEKIKGNFISKGFYEALRYKMLDVFLLNRANDLNSNSIDAFGDLFEKMELTDANHVEQPYREWMIKGDTIGWALTTGTYSGQDAKRGTLNISESFVTRNGARFVFDFGTDKANGTFQSIYFSPQDAYSLNTNSYYHFEHFDYNIRSLVQYNNKYFVLSTDNDIYIYDIDFNLVDGPIEIIHSNWIRDFTIYNNYIYYSHDWSSHGIQRAPISDPSNVEIVLTGELFRGIHYDSENQNFWASLSGGTYSEGYYLELREYNSNFEILNSKKISTGTSAFSENGIHQLDNGLIFGRSWLHNTNSNELRRNLFRQSITGVDNNYIFINNRILPKIFIGSRALLDSPVTKTDSVTMKITYDFDLRADDLV